MKKFFSVALAIVVMLLLCGVYGCAADGKNKDPGTGGTGGTGGAGNKEDGLNYFVSDKVAGTHIYNAEPTGKMLVTGGKTEYEIVLPQDATDLEQTAAEELSYFFDEATGILLRTRTDLGTAYSDTVKYISVGATSLLSEAGIAADESVLGASGLRIVTKGNSIFLFGATDRGTLFAVYEFLSQCFHYEFYADNIIHIDTGVTELELMKYDITDVPDYQYNVATYGYLRSNSTLLNRYRMVLDTDMIIPVSGVTSHNSFKWLPKADYQATYPEWYSVDGTQLCYTARGNEEKLQKMVDTVTEKMKAILADAQYADMRIITFTHEDTQTWCTCDKCTEIKNKYGGANSAGVIQFLNRVKANIDAWFEGEGSAYKRDLLILFLGYHQTNKPPSVYDEGTGEYKPIDESVRCRDGIGVYFAETNGDYTQSFYERNNADIAANMSGWSCLSNDIFFWSYHVNFSYYLTPYNSFNGMQDIYKYGKLHSAFLLFDQGFYNEEGRPTSWGMLKIYLSSKLAWNVNADFNALIDAFFENYFGPAAKEMRSIFDSFRVRAQYNEQYNGYNGSRSIFTNALQTKFWPASLLRGWMDSCERALTAIEPLRSTDPALYEAYRKNIAQERISVLYLYVELYDSLLSIEQTETYKQQFMADAVAAGLTKEGEKANISQLYTRWGL